MGLLIHFRGFLFSLIFAAFFTLLALKIISAETIIGIILLVGMVLMTIYIAHRLGKSLLYVITPLGITMCSLGLLYFIDSQNQRIIFVSAASVLYYVALLGIVRLRDNLRDITAHSFYNISTIALIFLFYAVSYGVYINFAIALWVFLLVQFIVIFLVVFTSLRMYQEPSPARPLLYALILAFSMAQIGWMANFWPFGYLTAAAVSLMLFYVLLDVSQMMFLEQLSKTRTLINIIFAIVLLSAVLLSTRWVLLA